MTTQVSAPKISTNWTTALKKKPETRGAAPYLLRVRVSLLRTSHALSRFLTTAGQSLSAAEIFHSKYLKEVIISRGRPYALKALKVAALSSSTSRCHIFCFTPLFHCMVRQCIPFRSRHGTIMSHRGHCGWGRFPSSKITTVSQTCRYQKCTSIAIRVATQPLHPSIGQGLGIAFSGNVI